MLVPPLFSHCWDHIHKPVAQKVNTFPSHGVGKRSSGAPSKAERSTERGIVPSSPSQPSCAEEMQFHHTEVGKELRRNRAPTSPRLHTPERSKEMQREETSLMVKLQCVQAGGWQTFQAKSAQADYKLQQKHQPRRCSPQPGSRYNSQMLRKTQSKIIQIVEQMTTSLGFKEHIFFVVVVFRMGACCSVQAGLQLLTQVVLPPQPLKC